MSLPVTLHARRSSVPIRHYATPRRSEQARLLCLLHEEARGCMATAVVRWRLLEPDAHVVGRVVFVEPTTAHGTYLHEIRHTVKPERYKDCGRRPRENASAVDCPPPRTRSSARASTVPPWSLSASPSSFPSSRLPLPSSALAAARPLHRRWPHSKLTSPLPKARPRLPNLPVRSLCRRRLSSRSATLPRCHFTPFADSVRVLQVYYHVIYANTSLSGGYVPDSQITSQISVINSAYAGTGLSFTLASTTVSLFLLQECHGADKVLELCRFTTILAHSAHTQRYMVQYSWTQQQCSDCDEGWSTTVRL